MPDTPIYESIPERGVPESTLRDIYNVLFRHQWKIVGFFCAVIVIVTLGTFLAPEIYKSEAKLLVRLGRESVSLDPTATTGQVVPIFQPRENEINSILEILKSRELVEKIVDEIGPEVILERPDEVLLGDATAVGVTRDAMRKFRQDIRAAAEKPWTLMERMDLHDILKKRDKATLSIMNALEIEVPKASNLIAISYEAQNPQLAHEVISKLIDFYLVKHIEVYSTPGSYDFFIQQTDHLRSKLSQTEEDLRKLKNKTDIASVDEQRTIILGRLGVLQQEIESTEATLAASRARVEELQKSVNELPEIIAMDKTTGDAMVAQHLFMLQLKEQDLLSRYTEESQLVQEIRRQITEAKALMNGITRVTQGRSPFHQQQKLDLLSEQAALASLQAQAKALKEQLADVQAELRDLNDSEVRLVQLQRERELQEINYRKYSDNLEQARVDQALQIQKLSNISVAQPATFPMKPVRPRKLFNLSLGLFLGIFGAIGFAFFLEYVDQTLKTPEEIEERLQLRTLTTISAYPKKQG